MGLHWKKENGMTLVELLAAITILGILFLSLLYLLPQMTSSNLQTEVKLETMNLARAELVNLKEGNIELNEECAIELEDPASSIITYRYSDPETCVVDETDYVYEVDYYEEADVDKNTHDNSVQLNKIHIRVMKENKLISETFGYLESNE